MTPITIRLSDAACRYAIEGGLYDSPLGAEMHVALVNAKRYSGGNLRAVTAPIPAWLEFLSWLQTSAMTRPGDLGAERKRAECLTRAKRKIAQEFDRLAKHPAYRGTAVVGVSTTCFPAYRMGEGRWWPTPDMAFAASDGTAREVESAELRPYQKDSGSRVFTLWTVAA